MLANSQNRFSGKRYLPMWAWVSFPPIVCSSAFGPQSEGCTSRHPQVHLPLLLALTTTTDKDFRKHAGAQPSLPAVSGKPSGSLSLQDKHPHSCVPSLALVAASASQPFKSSFHTLTHLYTLSCTHVIYTCALILYHPHTLACAV